MPQKFFEPFKKIPTQFQHLNILQKLHGLTLGRSAENFSSFLSSTYGIFESPSATAFDDHLGLLAVGSKTGSIKVYGTPGVVLNVQNEGSGVVHLLFLPQEGRLVAALSNGSLVLYELDPENGGWSESNHVKITVSDKEHITSIALGLGIIYVGSSMGVLYQVAVSKGRMCLGDPTLTSLTSTMVSESLPVDKQSELGVDSQIVALQLHPSNASLLVAYANGCVAIVSPQPLLEVINEQPTEGAKTSVETEPAALDGVPAEAVLEETAVDEPTTTVLSNAETPQKCHTERRATQMLKELTRSLKRFELTKPVVDAEPPLPVPPPPRVTHVLIRDQPVEWATWRVHALDISSNEVTVAYGDGAFQVWPVTLSGLDSDSAEPIIVARRDLPSTPYGPLPCGAIKKIVQCPGASNAMFTIFSGGLPRAEFGDRHAVTVLQDSDHHVCFQFGSKIVDFLLLPRRSTHIENDTADANAGDQTKPHPLYAPQPAAVLLVLTERELVAIDLEQPNWPTFASPYLNCLDLSPVTAMAHLTKVSSALLSRLRDSAWHALNDVTGSQWPICGGGNCSDGVDLSHNDANDVVVLGHANGWVTLLGIGRGDSLHRLGAFRTDALFHHPDSSKCHDAVEVETWPPFRRVGDCALTEPFCQQPVDRRLAVTHLSAYASSESITLVVGGGAGQISVWTAAEHMSPVCCFEPDVSRIVVNLIAQDDDRAKYVWNGPPAFRPLEGHIPAAAHSSSAFHPRSLIQLEPPVPITTAAFAESWNLMAVGCSCGFAVVDTLSREAIWAELVLPECINQQNPRKTSHAINVAAMQTAFSNRRKQVTAQLRQSFRRLKQLRSPTTVTETDAGTPVVTTEEAAPVCDQPEVDRETKVTIAESACDTNAAADQPTEQGASPKENPDSVPISMEPVALSPEDQVAVRCLVFADTCVVSGTPAAPSSRTPCLFVGTTSGRVLVYGLSWDNTSGPVAVQLLKELQLQHRAPVIGLCVLDAHEKCPVATSARTRVGFEVKPTTSEPNASEEVTQTEGATTDELPQPPAESHWLLLGSEEQVKIFQLPSLRALHKCKFVDKLRLAGHFGTVPTSNGVGSEVAPTKSDGNDQAAEATVTDVESRASQTTTQPNHKSIRSFGLQAFARQSGRSEWHVVVARQDGQMVVLSLPHLKKVFKVKPTCHANMLPLGIPCVASHSDANYILWQAASQLFTFELCPNPRLLSPALVVPGTHAPPSAPIALPEWARPRTKTVSLDAEEQGKETEDVNGAGPECKEVPLIDGSGESVDHVNGVNETKTVEPVEVTHSAPEKHSPNATAHAGDVTIDSIKEYLNGDGTVTIKTIETSTEKRTLMEGGHMVTTLRETECVDGQVTKDDVRKFYTDDTVSPKPVVESS